MTDKQIIIDGVDVSGCCHQGKDNTCTCPHYKKECGRNPNCHYKIMQRQTKKLDEFYKRELEIKQKLFRKEQECEELKRANLHIENNREHKANKLNRIEKLILACKTGYTDEFIQELLVILHEPEPVSFENKYLQTLTEIKEIAERGFKHSQCNCGAKADLDLILQKISECEGNDENN